MPIPNAPYSKTALGMSGEAPLLKVSEEEGAEEPKKYAGKKEVVISSCPVHSVVVYPDRAEV